jgi:hypothetical protein
MLCYSLCKYRHLYDDGGNFQLFFENPRIISVIATPRETPKIKIIQKPASLGFEDILSLKTSRIENVMITERKAPRRGILCRLLLSTDITTS